jgi:cytoskeletal protein RodZ
MMEVGQLLRQTREAQELSLADIEEKTKIRQSFISALESGDWDDLPNEVVARGFLRKYAVALGLDPDELLAQAGGAQTANSGETTSPPQVSTTPSSVYQPINLDLYDVTPERSHRLRRVLGFLLALIPVAILAYLLIQFGLPLLLDQSAGLTTNPTATATLPPAGTPPTTPLIVVGGDLTPTLAATATPDEASDKVTDTPEPSATATPTPQPTPSPTATPIQQLTMRMEIVERAWVRVTVDGEVQLESLLDPVYVQEFVAQKSIELRTGNAAGVTLTLNGEQLPPLGETAEVVDLIWAIEDDKIVVMTPTPEPEPTGSPTATPEPDATGTPTIEPEITETITPTAEATATPTAEPDTPTPEPPTPEPTVTETPTPGA